MVHRRHLSIDELAIPSAASGPTASDFVEMVDLRNAIEADILGSDALAVTAEELRPVYTLQQFVARRIFLARVDGRIVGRAIVSWPVEGDPRVAWLTVEVLPDARRRGVGSALFDHLEGIARAAGRHVFQARAIHTFDLEGDRIAPPSGHGSVPRSDPGVRFMRDRGYRLEQVKRISFLDLPVDPDELARLRRAAVAVAGDDYEVIQWTGRTLPDWVGEMAVLRTHMSTDDPNADLDGTAQTWDAARVVAHDLNRETGGRLDLTVAVQHVPSARLVGFTELSVPRDGTRPVGQGETFVLSGHRGHRLGLLLKAANLQRLAALDPGSRLIYTFNAEENRHMLAVNEQLGFRGVGSEAAWKREAS